MKSPACKNIGTPGLSYWGHAEMRQSLIVRGGRYAFYQVARLWYDSICRFHNIDRKRVVDIFSGSGQKEIGWPEGKLAAFNLQFDDASAKDGVSDPYDYGGNPDGALVRSYLRLLEEEPELQVTLFVIPDPTFREKGFYRGVVPDGTWALDRRWAFSAFLKTLPRTEIANHGLHHYQDEVRYFLKAREFEFKTRAECRETIDRSQAIFERAGFLPIGFKPSGWGIGHNADFGLLEALSDSGFSYVALSSPVSGLNWDRNRVSNIYPQFVGGLLNIPQNVSLSWALPVILKTIDAIIERRGVVTIQGHFCEQDRWMEDGIGPRMVEKIRDVMAYVKARYSDQIWFAQLADIARFCHEHKDLV